MTIHAYRLPVRTTAPEAPGGIVALDESPARPLTHITGPCGGGKTVLARLLAEAFTALNPHAHVVWLSLGNPAERPNAATDPARVTILNGARDPRTDRALTDPHAALGLPAHTRVLTVVDEIGYGLRPSYRDDPQFVDLRAPLAEFVATQRRQADLVDHAGPAAPTLPTSAAISVPGPRVRVVLTSQHPIVRDLYVPELAAAVGTSALAGRCTTTAWDAFAGPHRDAIPAWAADQMGRQRGGYWLRTEGAEPTWFPCRVTTEESLRMRAADRSAA